MDITPIGENDKNDKQFVKDMFFFSNESRIALVLSPTHLGSLVANHPHTQFFMWSESFRCLDAICLVHHDVQPKVKRSDLCLLRALKTLAWAIILYIALMAKKMSVS